MLIASEGVHRKRHTRNSEKGNADWKVLSAFSGFRDVFDNSFRTKFDFVFDILTME